MSARSWTIVIVLGMGVGISAACGGGGSGGSRSPFPPAVQQLFDDLDGALRIGDPDLPGAITCGLVGNPFDRAVDLRTEFIAGVADNSGTVPQARRETTETRDLDGSGTFTFTIKDEADLNRVFLQVDGVFGPPAIAFLAPPLGANEFLAPDGTGQVFVVVTVDRTLGWTNTYQNDPAPQGGGTLVDFTTLNVIPNRPDGTLAGTFTEQQRFLVEFLVQAGPGGNTACIIRETRIGQAEITARTGSGFAVARLLHRHSVSADTGSGPRGALSNVNATILPVGSDPMATNPIADGDDFHIMNGAILGGIAGLSAVTLESRVVTRGGLILLSDGWGNPIDGDFDGTSTYDIDLFLSIGGTVGDGTVDVTVLTVETGQLEDPAQDGLDHPILDEFFLWGAVTADTETGLVIYH